MEPIDAARLEALETKVAYLEATLQQLGDELYRQQQELERVVERNRQLLDELGSAPAGSATDVEIPPHY
ncbi:MAG: SlyX family protein [Gammaproteobacteria bacterium]|nr:SlyX family protein [Gammaproteobacteria bacterium]